MTSSIDIRLRQLQAGWVLGRGRPELVPDVCTALLVDGLDSPALCRLAGLTAAELDDGPELLVQLFGEFGMGPLSPVQAAWVLVQELARAIVDSRIDPVEGARRIGAFTYEFDPLFPLLRVFIGLWSEWDDHPDGRPDYEADIREEARRLRETEPPPEPGAGSDTDRRVQTAALVAKEQQPRKCQGDGLLRLLAELIPAGRVDLTSSSQSRWTTITSHHAIPVLLVHSALPFGFVRSEVERFVHSAVMECKIQLAAVGAMDSEELSVTTATLSTLAGRALALQQPLGWLSANGIRDITDSDHPK